MFQGDTSNLPPDHDSGENNQVHISIRIILLLCSSSALSPGFITLSLLEAAHFHYRYMGQGCQMGHLHTNFRKFVILWKFSEYKILLYFINILVYCVDILIIIHVLGMLYHEELICMSFCPDG
jgi:hypothetical protein